MKFLMYSGKAIFLVARLVFAGLAWTHDRVFGGGATYPGARPDPRTPAKKQAAGAVKGDFAPTQQMAEQAAAAAPPEVQTVAPVAQPAAKAAAAVESVVKAERVRVQAPVPAASERVHLLEVVGPKNHLHGVIWFYLYPKEGHAKRLFKVHCDELARHMEGLKNKRYFMSDLPFDPVKGIEPLKSQTLHEVRRLMGHREAVVREPRKAMDAVPHRQVETPKVAAEVVQPAPARSQPAAAPADAPMSVRPVKGEAIVGTVIQARQVTRTGARGKYQSFCLMLHDGHREVPQYGAELERAVADQGIKVGERVRVVYMGKQPVDVPGSSEPIYKNLYQVTKLSAA